MKLVSLLAGTSLLVSAGAASAFTFVTPEKPMYSMVAPGWSIRPLVTIGETLPNGFRPVGIPDGIGAYTLDSNSIRAFVVHELGRTRGYPYTLDSGFSLTGARTSFFDIDKATLTVTNAGLAYTSIVDRAGNVVVGPGQPDGDALDRFCSAALFEANSFGPGRGLADRLFFTGEEGNNGTAFILDPETKVMYTAPWLGRGSWENAAVVDTGTTSKVALVLADDSTGYPLYLHVGTKSTDPGAGFLERNGLSGGKLYAWKADSGDTDPNGFRGGFGDTRTGTSVELTHHDSSRAGTPGWDALGFADDTTLKAEAAAKGAFLFARPEDVATNPADGQLIAFVATGRPSYAGGADSWGTTFTVKLGFDADGNPTTADATIIDNGDVDPSRALRSPDNRDWAGPTRLLIQEDRAFAWSPADNPNEAGMVEVDVTTGAVRRIANIDRSAVPAGMIDEIPTDFGNWESSGILEISALFGLPLGRMFLAHGAGYNMLAATRLWRGGPLAVDQPGFTQLAQSTHPLRTGNAAVPGPGGASPRIRSPAINPTGPGTRSRSPARRGCRGSRPSLPPSPAMNGPAPPTPTAPTPPPPWPPASRPTTTPSTSTAMASRWFRSPKSPGPPAGWSAS